MGWEGESGGRLVAALEERFQGIVLASEEALPHCSKIVDVVFVPIAIAVTASIFLSFQFHFGFGFGFRFHLDYSARIG